MSASSGTRGREFVRQVLIEACEDEEADAGQVLEYLAAEADDAAGDLARLAAYDLDPDVQETAAALLAMSQRDPIVESSVARRLGEGALAVLGEALANPDLPDQRKFLIGPLFALCGGELGDEEYARMFGDFDALMRRHVSEITADLTDQPPSIERLLRSMVYAVEDQGEWEADYGACDVLLPLAGPLAERDPSAAAALAGAAVALDMEREPFSESARVGVQMIAEHPCPRAAFVLRELGAWPAGGPVGAQARRAAEAMVAAGLTPRAELDTEFSHALVTSVDGVGSRMVHVYYRAAEGGLDVASVMCNEDMGVKDAWMVPDHGAEIEAELRAEETLTCAPCDLSFVREILADAWARHEELEQPPFGRLFNLRPYFGEEPIEPRRRTPDLGAYGLDQMPRTADLVEGSEQLLESPCYGLLWFASDAAYAFIENVRRHGGSRRLSEEALLDFIAAVEAHERDTLLRRMAVNLEVEALAGRAAEPVNQRAVRTWLALSERIVPFEDVPFIQILADMSAKIITDNLQHGFHNQAEIDRMTAETGELPWNLEDEEEEEEEEDDFFFGRD